MESFEVIRTQIQLGEQQARLLKALAAREGRSMADLIRESVDTLLRQRGRPDPDAVRRLALEAVGIVRSGLGDLSTNHDRYLDEAYDG